MQRSLVRRPGVWREAVDNHGLLTEDRSWVLLGWAERSAVTIALERRPGLLRTTVFAMALLDGGPLDLRDVSVVAGAVRGAADVAGLDHPRAVQRGCRLAGRSRAQIRLWLDGAAAAPVPGLAGHLVDGAASRPRRREPRIEVAGGRSGSRRGVRTVRPWPLWLRWVVVLVALVLLGHGVASGIRNGFTAPLLGPAIAMLSVPLVTWLAVPRAIERRFQRLVASLQRLERLVAAEHDSEPATRATGASQAELSITSGHLEDALRQLAWGLAARSLPPVERMLASTRDWEPGSRAAEERDRAAAATRRLARMLRRTDRLRRWRSR